MEGTCLCLAQDLCCVCGEVRPSLVKPESPGRHEGAPEYPESSVQTP